MKVVKYVELSTVPSAFRNSLELPPDLTNDKAFTFAEVVISKSVCIVFVGTLTLLPMYPWLTH